jgi:hypothetical protein
MALKRHCVVVGASGQWAVGQKRRGVRGVSFTSAKRNVFTGTWIPKTRYLGSRVEISFMQARLG